MRQPELMGKSPPSYMGNESRRGPKDQYQYRPQPKQYSNTLISAPAGGGGSYITQPYTPPHTVASILEQEPAWAVCDCSPEFPAGPSNHHSTADSAKDLRNPHV